MKGSPRSSAAAAWELPGVQAVLRQPRRLPELGADWALVVFCTFAGPPALLVAGLLHAGSAPVLFWIAACVLFFTGLGLTLRLEPLPPRRVLAARRPGAEMLTTLAALELDELELPDISPGMSRSDILEQLAKLREQGKLSGPEYARACALLTPELR